MSKSAFATQMKNFALRYGITERAVRRLCNNSEAFRRHLAEGDKSGPLALAVALADGSPEIGLAVLTVELAGVVRLLLHLARYALIGGSRADLVARVSEIAELAECADKLLRHREVCCAFTAQRERGLLEVIAEHAFWDHPPIDPALRQELIADACRAEARVKAEARGLDPPWDPPEVMVRRVRLIVQNVIAAVAMPPQPDSDC
jgi:hypothetical protein